MGLYVNGVVELGFLFANSLFFDGECHPCLAAALGMCLVCLYGKSGPVCSATFINTLLNVSYIVHIFYVLNVKLSYLQYANCPLTQVIQCMNHTYFFLVVYHCEVSFEV